jgi:hypothetical protein
MIRVNLGVQGAVFSSKIIILCIARVTHVRFLCHRKQCGVHFSSRSIHFYQTDIRNSRWHITSIINTAPSEILGWEPLLRNDTSLWILKHVKITVFWDITPYSSVDGYQRCRETCYLHLPEYGGSRFLRNTSIDLPNCRVKSQIIMLILPREPQMLHWKYVHLFLQSSGEVDIDGKWKKFLNHFNWPDMNRVAWPCACLTQF